MGEIVITAKKKMGDEERECSISYDFGDTLADAVEMFGEEVVFSNFKGSAKITAQAAMRRYIESGLNADQITDKMSIWKPGVALERAIDPVKALLGRWGKMDQGEKAEVLRQLKEADKASREAPSEASG